MHRNRDVEGESPVVHHVDREEQRRANAPFSKGHRRRLNEEAALWVELVVQGREAGEHELEKSNK